ncbi:MAG: SDR family oxidoreductase [Polyangiaceae bacterium]
MTNYAIVTGASAGLGKEFAKLAAADGYGVVLVARRKDELESLSRELGVPSLVHPMDLSDPATPKELFDKLSALGVTVDVLVNNAGLGSNGQFWELDERREMGMIQVNVTALVHLTRLFLPGMIQRGRGHVLNIGSTAGYQPGPYMTTYYASKAFVNSFTEGLAFELRGTGVTATLSCPGATATEFSSRAGNDKSRLFQMGGVADSATVAREAWAAMKAKRRTIVHGLKNKAGVHALRVSPKSTAIAIAARLNRGT